MMRARMSALGQKRRSAHVRVMSPLPPKANIAERPFDLCDAIRSEIILVYF